MKHQFSTVEIDNILEMDEREITHGRMNSIVDLVMTEGGRIAPRHVIDPRIDVGAQRAILRMARAMPRQRADALGMLSAVKSGQLHGIYGNDLRAAAQLAAQLGTVRWQLVPRGQDAVLIRSPDTTQAPTIIFREQVRSVPSRLDPALRRAFGVFRRTVGRGVILRAASTGENPWLCSMVCAFCAALLLDGIPFDEIAFCGLCLKCVAGSA